MTWSGGRALPGNRWDLLAGVAPSDPPRVSVIVAHYRQPEQLRRTLRALQRQDHPQDRLEIIVADDGSPERPSIPPGVRLVRQPDEGFRLAAVRNLGATAASGDILVFLDADTAPERGFVREVARLPALAPDCVAVGRRRHADLAGAPSTADIDEAVKGRELADPAWLADAYRASRDLLDADDRSYRFVIGAVLACSRRMFDEVGGFDETFTSYGGEDWEWAYRAWIRGGLLAHVPTAVAWHDGPDIAGRPAADGAKNDETIRLAELIPVPGSRGHGVRPSKIDIAVSGPRVDATAGQRFISIDSTLAAVSGAEWVPDLGDPELAHRLDRVRVSVQLLRPVRVSGDALADQVRRIALRGLGEIVLTDDAGEACIRIVSLRARARKVRWGRDDLFARERVPCKGLHALDREVDVEGYLGGWG